MFSHTRPIDLMMKKFKDLAVRVDGKVTDKKLRTLAVRRFQRDKTCRLFVGNSRAAGVGLTLTAASTLVIAELGWTPGEIRQVEDRVHRISQDNPVTIIYLVAKGSVEEKVARIIATKDDILNAVLDGGSQEKWQVHRLLKRK
jgi:SWI/SNF-related matrix-associated actin-dependent regulator 1 of chromatin subfamily A